MNVCKRFMAGAAGLAFASALSLASSELPVGSDILLHLVADDLAGTYSSGELVPRWNDSAGTGRFAYHNDGNLRSGSTACSRWTILAQAASSHRPAPCTPA